MGSSGRSKLYAGLAIVLLPALTTAGQPVLQSNADALRLYDEATRRSQYQSLQGVATAEIEYGQYGRLRSLNGRTGIVLPGAAQIRDGDSGTAILEMLKPMLMATELDTLKVRKVVHAFGSRTIFLDQLIDGISVIDGGVNVRASESGELILVSSLFVPADTRASRKPSLSPEAAITRLEEQLVASGLRELVFAVPSQARLAYWTNQGNEERARLAWLLAASHMNGDRSREGINCVVDAASGEVLHLERQAVGLNRTTYQLNTSTNLDIASYPTGLTLLWNEGSPNPAYVLANSVYTKVESPRNVWASLGMHYDTFGLVTGYYATYSSWWGTNTTASRFLYSATTWRKKWMRSRTSMAMACSVHWPVHRRGCGGRTTMQ